jgi:putative nucleotidyltransferase with HDIG domain
LLATAAFGLMQKQSWQLIATQSAQTTISAMVSVIAAIGIMPLFELIFNTVSPLRLIELSQPGHTLLKRLFIEAPGTSQHSMMVANLADTAAEAIGANAMIARVGAYYHDIGKLEDPVLFMENQKGENPNDLLTPEESTRRITSHTEDGVRIARRFRLPQPVLRIIQEHHGTTVLQFFYHRAVELAEAEGRDAPDPDQYRYHNPIPSSRESAVVMLADSTEAAMKASDVEDLTAAEEVIRGVVRSKIDQDQLADSELSFADVETIVQAFLQVYAGHFHERIAYPAEPAKRI